VPMFFMRMHLTSALPLATALGATLPVLPLAPAAYLDAIHTDGARLLVALFHPLEVARAMPAYDLTTHAPRSAATRLRALRMGPIRKLTGFWRWGR
jgi:hypothetical protein